MTRTPCGVIDSVTGYACTMDKDHTGPHVATQRGVCYREVGGNVLAIWPNVPKVEPEVERIVYTASLLASMDARWWAYMAGRGYKFVAERPKPQPKPTTQPRWP